MGIAVSSASPSVPFEPAFCFMASALPFTASSSSADPRPPVQCSYVSCHALCRVEELVEECLALDNMMGLEAGVPHEAHACCLVAPPGYAIVDTGCTSTLVGSDSDRLWREELQRKTGGSLQGGRQSSEVRLEGINGRGSLPVRLSILYVSVPETATSRLP